MVGLFDDMMDGARIAKGFFRGIKSTFRFISKNAPKAMNFAKKQSKSISKQVDKFNKKS